MTRSAPQGLTALVAELWRARALGENPTATMLWTHAPWALRRQFADGFIDAETFWNGLLRWFEWEEGAA